jgi:hypothetical protein
VRCSDLRHRNRGLYIDIRAASRIGALALIVGLALSAGAIATPASAATVGTIADLQAALDTAQADPSIVLSGDISAADTVIDIPWTAQLDLNGFTLDTNDATLFGGVTLTVDDSSAGGTGVWNAGGQLGGNGYSAIEMQGSTFVVNGGTITATASGIWGAGIGGTFGDGGNTIVINDGTVTARGSRDGAGIGEGTANGSGAGPTTVTINGGDVTAEGGANGAGIGGGAYSLAEVDVTVNGGIVNSRGAFYGAGLGGAFYGQTYKVVINGGDVTASGGPAGAGIGGAGESNGGSTLITGGTVHAYSETGAGIGTGQGNNGGMIRTTPTDDVVTITGGVVVTSSSSGTGLGGGMGTSIASITIGDGATVTASASAFSTAVGGGSRALSHGAVTIGGELIIPSGGLTLAAAESMTVTSTGAISGAGTVNGSGSLINHGRILNASVANLADGAGVDVTDHDYKISFDGNYPGAATIPAVRVYATTFTGGARTLPTPTRTGYVVSEWNTAADGSGSAITASSTLSADATLYAQWANPYTLSPAGATATAGGTPQFTVARAVPFGSQDASADFTYASDDSSDTVQGPGMFGVTRAGTRMITATLTTDPRVTLTTTLTVVPAAAATLDVTSSADSVDRGGSVTLTLDLRDAYGNRVSPSGASITSDHPSDVIQGTTVTFPSASTHVLTASRGGLSASVSITVIPTAAPLTGGLAATGLGIREPLALASLLFLLGIGIAVAVRRSRLRA